MYKIIHTADWHLGQSFKNKSRIEEHSYFLDWLILTSKTQNINAIIVAGDIFDVANPSLEAMDLYHNFLEKAVQLQIEVIIIGGNHDSAARLNTTGTLLKLLNLHIVGGEANALGQIIPLKNKITNEIETVVVAIPYLRDGDVRKINENESIKSAKIEFELSVKTHYDKLLKEAQNNYPSIPIIGTAHLYVNGSTISDKINENMHKIGTLGQINTSAFSNGFSYMALGHIHKPQILKHSDNVIVKYAGSPIPLSFSERVDEKEITILEILNGKLNYEIIPIESNRNLKRFKGNAKELLNEIKQYITQTKLSTWAEIIITEKLNYLEFNKEIDEIASNNNIEILEKLVDIPSNKIENIRYDFNAGTNNNPLDDIEKIFKIKCKKVGLNQENMNEILPIFNEILSEIKHN